MKLYIMLLCMTGYMTGYAQNTISIKITDQRNKKPIEFASVISKNHSLLGTSDSNGTATILVQAGASKISVVLAGYEKLDTTLQDNTRAISIELVPTNAELEEVAIIASTRTNQGIENSPLKVEVLGTTELSEEAGIKPGNIASILGDVSGVQIQQSSATSGNSNIRIQGLDGRYTQILRDGMPLYDGFSGGFGILTVPPLDLKQIELIKGAASTLFGGGAIGGIVNLISKRPTYKQSIDAIGNYTSLHEFNANTYVAKRNDKFGYTLFAGYTGQKATDVDGDGFSDVPDISSVLLHPKMFYYPNSRTTIALGYSGSFDTRNGGDMQVLNGHTDSLHSYFEKNTSARHTCEYLFEHSFDKEVKLTLKGNMSNFNRLANTNSYDLQGNQTSYYSEASLFIPMGKDEFAGGINIVGDDYQVTKPDTALLNVYGNFTTGAFGQYSLHIKERTTIESGLRFDLHNKFGVFVLPRVAVFHRFNKHWASRAGFGMGYKIPNPLVQQNIDYNPLYLLPLAAGVKPEIAYGYNAEVNYKVKWSDEKSLFINQAFFLTQIERPIVFQQLSSAAISLHNASSPVISKGSDTYVKLLLNSWELYLGYTFTIAENTYLPTSNSFVPLTPKNRAAFVLVKEIKKSWRFGLEGSYIGSQHRYDATLTSGYVIIAAMLQKNLGKNIMIALNGENLLDYRMSRVEQLYTGSQANPTFKPLWAPIDGRVSTYQ